MLEIQFWDANSSVFRSLDLFGDEGVDYSAPLFPFTEIDEKLVEYTDSFTLKLTERNEYFLEELRNGRILGQIKNGNMTIKGFIKPKERVLYTPNKTITVIFVSIIKEAVDFMKNTQFAELFNDNASTGAPNIFANDNDTVQINKGGFHFSLSETMIPYTDEKTDLFFLSASNNVSRDYSGGDLPVYILDAKEGSRSMQPTFTLGRLIKALFKHYDIDIELVGQLFNGKDWNDIQVRIPTKFISDSSVSTQSRDYTVGFNNFVIDSITGYHVDPEFETSKELIDLNGVTRKYITPQHNVVYDMINNGTISLQNASLTMDAYWRWDTQDNDYDELQVNIPANKISYTGTVRPAIGIYKYDELIGRIPIGSNALYNAFNWSGTMLEAYKIEAKYGDAITLRVGWYAENLVVTYPESYDSYDGQFSSATKTTKPVHGYFELNDFKIPFSMKLFNNSIEVNAKQRAFSTVRNPTMVISHSYILTPEENMVEARWEDDVLLYNSFLTKDLTMYDLLMDIMKRFNLSLKPSDTGDLAIMNDKEFYKESFLTLDNRLSPEVKESFRKKEVRYITISNKNYGNINDKADILDDKDKSTIYDIIKYEVNENDTKEQKMTLNSAPHNFNIFGKGVSAKDADGWEFMSLLNDSLYWNIAVNEKIATEDLPITYGVCTLENVGSLRVPQSIKVNDESFPNATPNASIEYFETMATTYPPIDNWKQYWVMRGDYDLNMSDGKGGLNLTNPLYISNFERYFKRNDTSSINVEIEAYLTIEEVKLLRDGWKVIMFGDQYFPLSIDDVKFELEGGICTISMVQDPDNGSGHVTFDRTDITFDSTTITWDRT